MSRPCFALSVMLCCMAGPLLIIGKANARDTVVSSSHDPGECIVCPLAYSPLDICGGYSDYDYNQYWNEPASPPAAKAMPEPEPDPELEAAAAIDPATDDAWDADYEDYYADYVFGDDSGTLDDEALTRDDSHSVGEPIEVAEADVETAEASSEAAFELYDEFGWYSDDAASPEELFGSYDDYEPIAVAPPAAVLEERNDADYEAYEEEWFSYGAETTIEPADVSDAASDEAYESLSESSDNYWGDEEEWYRNEYDADQSFANEGDEEAANLETVELAVTGYDPAYDEAMNIDTAEPLVEGAPATDDYESFYDAYDDLYNYESTPFQVLDDEAAVEPLIEQAAASEMAPESDGLQELVDRLLAPVWTVTGGIAANSASIVPHSTSATYVDKCVQEWDCEADYWARPQVEESSVVLDAADALDGMAVFLRNAADALRGLASQSVADTAQAKPATPAR